MGGRTESRLALDSAAATLRATPRRARSASETAASASAQRRPLSVARRIRLLARLLVVDWAHLARTTRRRQWAHAEQTQTKTKQNKTEQNNNIDVKFVTGEPTNNTHTPTFAPQRQRSSSRCTTSCRRASLGLRKCVRVGPDDLQQSGLRLHKHARSHRSQQTHRVVRIITTRKRHRQ